MSETCRSNCTISASLCLWCLVSLYVYYLWQQAYIPIEASLWKSFEDWVESEFFHRGFDLLLPGPEGHYHYKFNSCLDGFVDLSVFRARLWLWILREYAHTNKRETVVLAVVLWMQVLFPLILYWGYSFLVGLVLFRRWCWKWFSFKSWPLGTTGVCVLTAKPRVAIKKPKKNFTGFGKCP